MEWAALIAIGMCLIMCNVIFEHRKNRKYFKQLGEFLLAKDLEWD